MLVYDKPTTSCQYLIQVYTASYTITTCTRFLQSCFERYLPWRGKDNRQQEPTWQCGQAWWRSACTRHSSGYGRLSPGFPLSLLAFSSAPSRARIQYSQAERQTERVSEREWPTETDRWPDRERKRKADRDSKREGDRQTDRQTEATLQAVIKAVVIIAH